MAPTQTTNNAPRRGLTIVAPYVATCIALCFLLLQASTSAQAEQIISVAFSDLMAGQFNVGYKAVEDYTLPPLEQLYLTGYYKGDWYGPGPDGLINYEQDNPAPAMKGPFHNGPDTVYHLLDSHHRTTALYRLSQIYTTSTTVTVTGPSGQPETVTIGPAPSSVYVEEAADWSTIPTDQFWADMLEGNTGGVVGFAPVDAAGSFAKSTNQPTYVWNYDRGQLVNDLNATPPPFIPGLIDDTLRSIAGSIATGDTNSAGTYGPGYQERSGAEYLDETGTLQQGVVLYYQQFYWANYLRPLVYWDTSGTGEVTSGMDPNAPYRFTSYDALILKAAELAHGPAARALPGYFAVPEIDPVGMGSVLALVTAALGLLERRRLKAKQA